MRPDKAKAELKPSDKELHSIERHLQESLEKLVIYERMLNAVENGDLSDPDLLENCPEIVQVTKMNAKLSYRAQILRQSIAEQELLNAKQIGQLSTDKKRPSGENIVATTEKKRKMGETEDHSKEKSKENEKCDRATKKERCYVKVLDYGDSLLNMLRVKLAKTVSQLYPELDDFAVVITEATQTKFGDYQFNSSMAISQKLKQIGKNVPPRDVANAIVKNAPAFEKVEKMEVAGPGYINIFLDKDAIARSIATLAIKAISVPKIEKRRVLVDFSSPNIAKEMHVGHLRSTIIGESICRLMEFVGFDVLRINHIGDWGTQFGMLIAHLRDRFPNFLNEAPLIGDLQAFYKESKKRFDDDKAFKAQAYECVVKLQNYEPDFIKAWQLICDISRKDFNRIYDRLDVKIEERGESFYQKLMVELVAELEEQGVLESDEGRKIFRVEGEQIPLTVVKSDGGFTYDTSDLAAIKQRIEDEKADWIIYVVDAGQGPHFNLIYAAARQLGWYKPEDKRIEHVAFGLVLGENRKKFKTRSGDTIRLTDLLDEGVKRAAAKLQEKGREKVMTEEELIKSRDAVAYGCIKYADLSQTRTQDYVFSFDKMLDDRGNTAVYLLYAYARIRSICRNSGKTREDIMHFVRSLPDGKLPLNRVEEMRLCKAILRFSDCLLAVLDNFMLHQLCDYLYNLATIFHDFYTECYVIHKNLDGKTTLYFNRLVLCQVTADTMQHCFHILGLRTVERM